MVFVGLPFTKPVDPAPKRSSIMARRILPLLLLGAIVAGWRAQPLNAKPENQVPPGPARIRECGITITTPGAYVLEGNLSSPSPQTCITIESRYVTIDLAGFAIVGSGDRSVPTYRGIHVEPGLGFEGITVRNGSIQAFHDGVSLEGAAGSNVDNMRVVFNQNVGISLHTGIARNNTLWANGVGVRCVAALVVENAFLFGNGLQVDDVFNNCALVNNAL
jgi:hypothetical protein